MIIKKHPNRNDYCLSKCGYWVRDFTKPIAKPIDINNMLSLEDMKLIIENEFKNSLKKYQPIEENMPSHDNIIIIGDGYGFDRNLKAIESLPPNVVIIGVNGAFSKWKSQKRLNYYVVNNPYQDCLYSYPQIITNWPKLISSTRTLPHFLEVYGGQINTYYPTSGKDYSGFKNDAILSIDDYRNPMCAAIGLSYKFKASKILIMSSLEMYDNERPGTERVKNKWIYPQQKIAHQLIDANLYWMQKAKIKIGYTDTEPDYEFATYIEIDDLKRFFSNGQK